MWQGFQRFNRINYGAESEVLSELLGICTVGLFCSLVGLFSPVAAEYRGAYLGSVTGHLESIKKKWGAFVPALPHWDKRQSPGDLGRRSRRTTRDSGMMTLACLH